MDRNLENGRGAGMVPHIGRVVIATVLTLLCTAVASPQANTRHRGSPVAANDAAAGQQAFKPGEAIQIQAADGTWISGTVQAYDAAAGKYQVALENGMSGWALPNALRRGSGAAPDATPAMNAVAPGTTTGPSICSGKPACTEVSEFAATIVDFRMSSTGRMKVLDVGIRFLNKTTAALALGYLDGSGGVIDDQGIRWSMDRNGIRGIGVVSSALGVEAKFVLQPGESRDSRFEFQFYNGQDQPVGTSFEVDLTLRILDAAGGGQYKLGAEYPLVFQGLGQTVVSTVQAAAATSAPAGQSFAGSGGSGAAQANSGPVPAGAVASGQGSRRAGLLGGLSQAAGMIPGGAGGSGGKTGTVVTQVQTLIPGFSGSTAAPSGTASDNGGAAGMLSQASTLIPGLSGATPAASGGITATAPMSPVASGNICNGQPACFNAGSFAATVTRAAGSSSGANQYAVRLQILFRNVSATPVTLVYAPGSLTLADNVGNRFSAATTGSAQATLTIPAGQSRIESFPLSHSGAMSAVGIAFSVTLPVSEVDLSTGQPRVARQDQLRFNAIACNCAALPTAQAGKNTNTKSTSTASVLGNLLKKSGH